MKGKTMSSAHPLTPPVDCGAPVPPSPQRETASRQNGPTLRLYCAKPDFRVAPFSHHIKDLRQRFGGKQWWLAYVSGCTDAAVSYWESGKRIPAETTLARIVDALTREGASEGEVDTLRRSWLRERVSRQEAKGRRSGASVVVTASRVRHPLAKERSRGGRPYV
jgi:DNA-binding transcriptional regulator YiaG